MPTLEQKKLWQQRYRESGRKAEAEKARRERLGPETYKEKQREYNRRYYEKNPERVKAVNAERKRRLGQTTEQKQAARESLLRRKFGLTSQGYDAMLEAQGHACAICRSICSSGRRLAVDHNHVTGKVRGLLCTPCNTTIGLVKEDEGRLSDIIEYLLRNR